MAFFSYVIEYLLKQQAQLSNNAKKLLLQFCFIYATEFLFASEFKMIEGIEPRHLTTVTMDFNYYVDKIKKMY